MDKLFLLNWLEDVIPTNCKLTIQRTTRQATVRTVVGRSLGTGISIARTYFRHAYNFLHTF